MSAENQPHELAPEVGDRRQRCLWTSDFQMSLWHTLSAALAVNSTHLATARMASECLVYVQLGRSSGSVCEFALHSFSACLVMGKTLLVFAMCRIVEGEDVYRNVSCSQKPTSCNPVELDSMSSSVNCAQDCASERRPDSPSLTPRPQPDPPTLSETTCCLDPFNDFFAQKSNVQFSCSGWTECGSRQWASPL